MRRLTIWHALSELFRDSRIDAADHDAIARRLNAVGCGRAEAETIMTTEVAPVFYRNLDKVNGAKGWNQGEVRWLVSDFVGRAAPVRWMRTRQARRGLREVADHWSAVTARLAP